MKVLPGDAECAFFLSTNTSRWVILRMPESRVVRRARVTLADGDGPSSGTSTTALCVDALAKQLH